MRFIIICLFLSHFIVTFSTRNERWCKHVVLQSTPDQVFRWNLSSATLEVQTLNAYKDYPRGKLFLDVYEEIKRRAGFKDEKTANHLPLNEDSVLNINFATSTLKK